MTRANCAVVLLLKKQRWSVETSELLFGLKLCFIFISHVFKFEIFSSKIKKGRKINHNSSIQCSGLLSFSLIHPFHP
jgi:hypothetical protein